MPKKYPNALRRQVLDYLEDHTWDETIQRFDVSRGTIADWKRKDPDSNEKTIVLKVSSNGAETFKEVVRMVSNGKTITDDEFVEMLLEYCSAYQPNPITISSIVDEPESTNPPRALLEVTSSRDGSNRRTNLSVWIEKKFDEAYPASIKIAEMRDMAEQVFKIAYDKQVANAIMTLKQNGVVKRVGHGKYQLVVKPPQKAKRGPTNKIVVKDKSNGFQCPNCGKKSVQVRDIKHGAKIVRAFSCRDCHHNWRENV